MATIDERYFKVYQDGRDRLSAVEYMQERETFRLAINDLEAKLERAGLDEIEGITTNLASMREAINQSIAESSTLNEQTTEQLEEVISTIEDIRQNGTGIDAQARQGVQTVVTQLAEMPKKVNGISPDEDGNIVIPVPEVDTSTLASKDYVTEKIVEVNTGGTVDISTKANVTYVDEMNGINNYTTVPVRENGVVVAIEERQGTTVVSRIVINRNSAGEVISTSKNINGKTVTSTYNKENGQLVSISKTLGGN